MNKTIRRGRARLVPRVSAELAERLQNVCASSNVTQTAVVETALRQHLDGTSDRTLMFRRLDRLGRAMERSQRDLELLAEAFSVFVRVWFAHTRGVPEEDKTGARRDAEQRYLKFVEHVGQQYSGGHRFLDDLPRESVADDAELVAVAESASEASDPP
jgi:hypothetical protein